MRKFISSKGFSLTELILVMGIIAIVSSFVTLNLVGRQRSASLNSTIDVLVSDISSQQTKAMVSEKENPQSPGAFGIYFLEDRYILFKGESYLPEDPSNFTVMLEAGIEFSTVSLPANSIVFSPLSGEISGFLPQSSSLTIHDNTNGENKVININRYGVVKSIN